MEICIPFVLLTNPKLKENAIQYTLLKFLFAKYPLVEEKKRSLDIKIVKKGVQIASI